ncbi:acetyltransferase [Pontibacter chitinilyticus]|uniref:acetyltransferase n=1 Tax=Pontibacter chitinilyticus TaxID=2674989 RepID=UPI0032196D16
MTDIAIVGAGGLGREVLVLLHQINDVMPQWNVTGFYDDNLPAGYPIDDYTCLGTVADLAELDYPLSIAVGIGSPVIKTTIVKKLQRNQHLCFPTLIHPAVQLKPYQRIELGEGVILSRGTILTTSIRLGHHVFVNLSCTIGHDAILEDYVALMPGVNISGGTRIGAGTYMGTNATVLQNLHIGAGSFIGAGAVVITAIPAGSTAVGVPAKIIKQHEL